MHMQQDTKAQDAHPGFLSTELANTLTHGAGLLFSVACLTLMVVWTSLNNGPRAIVACSVYGATLVLLYLASTLYHSARNPKARRALRAFDHASIYLLIAGTYTPFTLITLNNAWGWSIFGVVWGLAVLGVIFKLFYTGRYRAISLGIYLGMGWLSLIIIQPLLATLPVGGIWWLLAGGLCYTGGVGFYLWHSFKFHHAIWHLFVMAGSTCHFFAVMFYVLPTAA